MNMQLRCVCGKPPGHAVRLQATDADSRLDPTGTSKVRAAFQRDMDRRWTQVKALLMKSIKDRFTNSGLNVSHAALTGQSPVVAFQAHVDEALRQLVLGYNGSWTARYVRDGAKVGAERAARLVQTGVAPADRVPVLQQLVISELRGICEAASQQMVRAYGVGLLSSATAMSTAQAVAAIADKVGRARSRALVQFSIVRAHAMATLDGFRANGVTHVGTVAERTRSTAARNVDLVRDAGPDDEPRDERGRWSASSTLADLKSHLNKTHPTVYHDIYEGTGSYKVLAVSKLVVPDDQRNKGLGTSLMQEVHRYADAKGLTTVLSPSDQFGGNKNKLIKWYKSLGYVQNKGRKIDYAITESMYRLPKTVAKDADPVFPSRKVVRAENKLRRVFGKSEVDVLTAGDDRVCPICEDISEEGPYTLDQAEGLIPQHPGCRCSFIPADDARYASVHDAPRLADSTTHIAAGVMILDPQGRALFLKRSTNGDHAGEWAFPAGAVEPGETAEMAAARETQEELGFSPTNLEQIDRRETDGVDFTTFGTMVTGKFAPTLDHEHTDWCWRALTNPPEPLHPGVRATVAHAVLGTTADAFNPDEPRDPQGKWTTGGGSINMSDLTKISGKKGSNEGGVYSPNSGDLENLGKQYYIKQPASKDHVQNELTAAALYKVAGVNTMEYVPVKGARHVATVLQPLDKNNISQFTAGERYMAQKDFAVHAWLANHDAAGTGGDNQVIVGGKVTTVDTGGSLKYRAQGALKENFGEKVVEINNMRDPSKSPDAAALYGSMTNEQIKDSIKRVTDIPSHVIDEIIDKNMPNATNTERAELANKLIARKHDLAAQAAKMSTPTAFDPEPQPTNTAPPAFKTKMEHAKYLLMKGTTSEELKKSLNWPAIGVPATAASLNLKLEKTKVGGAFFYKGTPMTPEEIKAAKGAKSSTVTPFVPPVAPTPVPSFAPSAATQAELDKAKKNAPLLLQHVPGAPQNHPEAQKLVDKFNAKYAGQTIHTPEALQNKVADFKKLQADMVPLMTAQQQAEATAKASQLSSAAAKKAAAAKAEADKIANLHTLPEEEQRRYWLDKTTGGSASDYMASGENAIAKSKKLQQAGVTPAEVGFIKAFTGSYSDVNSAMRDGHMSEETFAFKHIMNDALAKMPPHDGSTVYRKISLDSSEQAKYQVGQIAHWKAFNSTSKNEGTWSGNTHFTILNPKTGVDVQSISSHPSEAEVIMPADSYYKVLSKKQSGGNTHITLEEVIPFGKKIKKVA